jgi:hypothetical protein
MSTAIYFGQDGARLLAKNQDVPYDGVYLFTNHRGMSKKAIVPPPHRPLEWISRHGSITVSQVGKELPNGGMNEAGLVVEQTTLWESSYSETAEQPAIGELQWIQWLLDTCASVQEAREAIPSVRIAQPMSRLHYILCDRSGDCAVVEFIDGTLHWRSGDILAVPVIANTSYAEALRSMRDADANWRRACEDYQRNSMERLVKAAAYLSSPFPCKTEEQVAYSFGVLQKVQREDTAFSLVYDLTRMELHFSSSRFPGQETIRLNKLDFSPEVLPMVLDLQQHMNGACEESFTAYNTGLNRTIAEGFFRNPLLTEAFGWEISEEMIDFMASFPDYYR